MIYYNRYVTNLCPIASANQRLVCAWHWCVRGTGVCLALVCAWHWCMPGTGVCLALVYATTTHSFLLFAHPHRSTRCHGPHLLDGAVPS